jgi:hypothetical protein
LQRKRSLNYLFFCYCCCTINKKKVEVTWIFYEFNRKKKTTSAYLSLHLSFFLFFRIHIFSSHTRILYRREEKNIYIKTKKIGRKSTNSKSLMSSILCRIRKNMEAEEGKRRGMGATEEKKKRRQNERNEL